MYLSTENWSRSVWDWRSGACTRESTSISAITPIPPSLTKLIDNELWLPGKTRRLVTLSLQVLRPLFQIASSHFSSLSVHCGCHSETSYANAIIQWHVLRPNVPTYTTPLNYELFWWRKRTHFWVWSRKEGKLWNILSRHTTASLTEGSVTSVTRSLSLYTGLSIILSLLTSSTFNLI